MSNKREHFIGALKTITVEASRVIQYIASCDQYIIFS